MVEIRPRLKDIDEYVDLFSLFPVHLELTEPFLSFIRFLLAESELDQLPVALLCRRKGNHVLSHVAEVVAGIRILACPKTLDHV